MLATRWDFVLEMLKSPLSLWKGFQVPGEQGGEQRAVAGSTGGKAHVCLKAYKAEKWLMLLAAASSWGNIALPKPEVCLPVFGLSLVGQNLDPFTYVWRVKDNIRVALPPVISATHSKNDRLWTDQTCFKGKKTALLKASTIMAVTQ